MNKNKLIKGFSSLAWGYIFIHINIDIVIIDLLPDWIGYCLLLDGILYISNHKSSAKFLRQSCILLILASVVEEAAKIYPISVEINLINLIVTIVSLYFHFQLLTEAASIAYRYEPLIGEKILFLRNARTILMTIFTVLYRYLDIYYLSLVLGLASIIIAFIIVKNLFKLRGELRLKRVIEEGF